MSISAARRAEFVGISGRAVLGAIRRHRSATQTVASAFAASGEPPTDASGCPTRAEGCGAALHVKYGPLQGADAGNCAQRDAAREDAGHVSTLYPKELQTELGGVHR